MWFSLLLFFPVRYIPKWLESLLFCVVFFLFFYICVVYVVILFHFSSSGHFFFLSPPQNACKLHRHAAIFYAWPCTVLVCRLCCFVFFIARNILWKSWRYILCLLQVAKACDAIIKISVRSHYIKGDGTGGTGGGGDTVCIESIWLNKTCIFINLELDV